jgi:hypothetical protein
MMASIAKIRGQRNNTRKKVELATALQLVRYRETKKLLFSLNMFDFVNQRVLLLFSVQKCERITLGCRRRENLGINCIDVLVAAVLDTALKSVQWRRQGIL